MFVFVILQSKASHKLSTPGYRYLSTSSGVTISIPANALDLYIKETAPE